MDLSKSGIFLEWLSQKVFSGLLLVPEIKIFFSSLPPLLQLEYSWTVGILQLAARKPNSQAPFTRYHDTGLVSCRCQSVVICKRKNAMESIGVVCYCVNSKPIRYEMKTVSCKQKANAI